MHWPNRPEQEGLFWAGSDDGLVHISTDGGNNWSDVTPPDLPEWALISIIEASPHDAATAYVAATRYKLDDTRPYLFKTDDFGRTWTKIVTGIPEDEFTRVIRVDPNRRGLLYAGTETGLYISFDDGKQWQRMGGNLPIVPIHDVTIKGVEMVVATHGRSFWILDDLSLFHQIQDGLQEDHVALFEPRPTLRMRSYGGDSRGDVSVGTVTFGNADTSLVSVDVVRLPDGSTERRLLDAGENPPSGAVIQYVLTAKPHEEVSLSILDDAGKEIRSFKSVDGSLNAKPGLNRFVWNLRLPGATNVIDPTLEYWHRPDGPMVLPGTYEVQLTVDGSAYSQSLQVESDPRISTTRADLQKQFEFLIEILGALSMINEMLNEIHFLNNQLQPWDGRAISESLRDLVSSIKEELKAIRGQLIDANIAQSQLWPSGLHEKFNALFDSVDSADYVPPRQAREVFAKLRAELDHLEGQYEALLAERLRTLNRAFEDAGLPIIGPPAS